MRFGIRQRKLKNKEGRKEKTNVITNFHQKHEAVKTVLMSKKESKKRREWMEEKGNSVDVDV